MIDQTTLEGKVVTAAMDLAASPGWGEISMRDIADAAGVPLADVLAKFPEKAWIIRAFSKSVDAAMLKGAGDIERAQTPRDALFEVIMARFDLMAPYKKGLQSIVADMALSMPDPRLLPRMMNAQNAILQAAGINPEGPAGMVRKLGLATVYGQVLRIWLDDDDAGMARTMAALDRRLRRGEQTLGTIEEMARSARRVKTGFATSVCGLFRRATRRDADDASAETADDSGVVPASPEPPPAAGGAPA